MLPGEKPRWQQLHEAHAEKQRQLDEKRRERREHEEAEAAQHTYRPQINQAQGDFVHYDINERREQWEKTKERKRLELAER